MSVYPNGDIKHKLSSQIAQVQILALLFISFVTLGM